MVALAVGHLDNVTVIVERGFILLENRVVGDAERVGIRRIGTVARVPDRGAAKAVVSCLHKQL